MVEISARLLLTTLILLTGCLNALFAEDNTSISRDKIFAAINNAAETSLMDPPYSLVKQLGIWGAEAELILCEEIIRDRETRSEHVDLISQLLIANAGETTAAWCWKKVMGEDEIMNVFYPQHILDKWEGALNADDAQLALTEGQAEWRRNLAFRILFKQSDPALRMDLLRKCMKDKQLVDTALHRITHFKEPWRDWPNADKFVVEALEFLTKRIESGELKGRALRDLVGYRLYLRDGTAIPIAVKLIAEPYSADDKYGNANIPIYNAIADWGEHEFLNILVERLNDPKEKALRAVIRAISENKDAKRACDILLNFLETEAGSKQMSNLTRSLGSWQQQNKPNPRVIEFIASGLASEEPGVRMYAAEYCGLCKITPDLKLLFEQAVTFTERRTVSHTDRETDLHVTPEDAAMIAIGRLQSQALHDTMGKILIRLLALVEEEPDKRFHHPLANRAAANCRCLGYYKNSKDNAILLKALSSSHPLVRQHAALALRDIADPLVATQLRNALNKEEELEVRAALMAALEAIIVR